jgi:hypothetical protein
VRLEGLGQLKKIHLIRTRTRDLSACSIVSLTTTLPRAPVLSKVGTKTKLNSDRLIQVSYVTFRQNIVKCILIVRQGLGKHIPAEANTRNSRTSIARQRISKHASLTTEAVFCVVYAQWLDLAGAV